MKKIVVGFSKSRKKFPVASWLIRLYQCTTFSHTYIKLLVKPRFPSNKILHASEGLVQNMSETQFDKKHIPVDEYLIEIPDVIVYDKLTNSRKSLYHALTSMMHETAGADYSMLQNIGILYVDIMRKVFKKRVKNPWQKGWNCSEFVASVLSMMYEEFKDLDPNTVTPKEVHEILEKLDKDPEYKLTKYSRENQDG